MLRDFNNIFQFSITAGEIIQNVLVAFFCGLIISYFYRKTYNGPGYLASFVNSLVILSMITAIVIMIIGNNLARAFGLVGAMSIIRFRTAVKETQDIIFIFFALAIGMAAGVGLHLLAIYGTFFVGIVFLVLAKSNLMTPSQKDFLLQFTYTANGTSDETLYSEVLKRYCKRSKLINAKSVGQGDLMELSYHIGLKNKELSAELVTELKKIKDINHVNLFFDEEYF